MHILYVILTCGCIVLYCIALELRYTKMKDIVGDNSDEEEEEEKKD